MSEQVTTWDSLSLNEQEALDVVVRNVMTLVAVSDVKHLTELGLIKADGTGGYDATDKGRMVYESAPPTAADSSAGALAAEYGDGYGITYSAETIAETARVTDGIIAEQFAKLEAEIERLQRDLAAANERAARAEAAGKQWKRAATYHRIVHHKYESILDELGFWLDIVPDLEGFDGYIKRAEKLWKARQALATQAAGEG